MSNIATALVGFDDKCSTALLILIIIIAAYAALALEELLTVTQSQSLTAF